MATETRVREYASALGIDLDALLGPISGEKPSGEWLRYEPLYTKIQTARRADDESLPQGIWKTAPKRADHAEVIRLCVSALHEQTKDVQLAAWLCEAWTRQHGLRGLCVGLRLLTELFARFWETLYPVLDEDGDTAYRLAPIESLDRALALQLKLLPITEPVLGQERVLNYADWERAQRAKTEESEGGALTSTGYLALAAQSPVSGVSALRTQLMDVQRCAAELESAVEQKISEQRSTGAGGDGVTLRELRGITTAMLGLLAQLPQSANATPADDVPAPASAGGAVPMQAATPVQAAPESALPSQARGPIRNRADAYLRLAEAAEYLLATEPHSPVPYLVRRAVSWGGMSLTQLLAELVQDDSDRRGIFALLAMRDPNE